MWQGKAQAGGTGVKNGDPLAERLGQLREKRMVQNSNADSPWAAAARRMNGSNKEARRGRQTCSWKE